MTLISKVNQLTPHMIFDLFSFDSIKVEEKCKVIFINNIKHSNWNNYLKDHSKISRQKDSKHWKVKYDLQCPDHTYHVCHSNLQDEAQAKHYHQSSSQSLISSKKCGPNISIPSCIRNLFSQLISEQPRILVQSIVHHW